MNFGTHGFQRKIKFSQVIPPRPGTFSCSPGSLVFLNDLCFSLVIGGSTKHYCESSGASQSFLSGKKSPGWEKLDVFTIGGKGQQAHISVVRQSPTVPLHFFF